MGLGLANVSAIDLGTIPDRAPEDEPDDEEIARVKRGYEVVQHLLTDCGQSAVYACHKVCEREQLVADPLLPALRRGPGGLVVNLKIPTDRQ